MITGEGARRTVPVRGARSKRAVTRRRPVRSNGNGHTNGNGNGRAPAPPQRDAIVDDVVLVNASIDGSLTAFEELYTRYFPRVRAFCYRKTGNPELAQDITQEAFTRAFERIDGFGGPKRFASWVGTIAANLVTDHYRRKSTSDVPLDTGLETDRLAAEDDPLADIERQSAREAVRPALDRLKPRQREALLLHEIEGLSCAAVGRRFGISEGAAESLVARGRRKLRREILAKASPDELLGIGLIGPMVPLWRVWHRVRDGFARRTSWLHDTMVRGVESLGVNAVPAGQAVKGLAVVVGTALALDAAAALIPGDPGAAAGSRPEAVIQETGGGAASGGADGAAARDAVLEPLGAREDFDFDSASGRVSGSMDGRVPSPGDDESDPGLIDYTLSFDGGTDEGSAEAGASLKDPTGSRIFQTGKKRIGWP